MVQVKKCIFPVRTNHHNIYQEKMQAVSPGVKVMCHEDIRTIWQLPSTGMSSIKPPISARAAAKKQGRGLNLS